MNDALAKDAVAENGYLRDRLRPRLLAGDQLQQRHVARRVEEVGDEEVAGEALRQAFGQQRQRQCRGVGRDDRAVLAHALETLVEVAFHLGIFQHRLDDPVAVGELVYVVLQIARRDQPGGALPHEGRRVAFSIFAMAPLASALRSSVPCGAPSGTMSSSSTGTPALASCAAMPAPITPAPITAACLMAI